jgi:hypothetical protein
MGSAGCTAQLNDDDLNFPGWPPQPRHPTHPFQPPQRPNSHSPNQRRLTSLPVRFGGTATGHSWSPPRISSVYQLHQYINTPAAVNLRAAIVRTIPATRWPLTPRQPPPRLHVQQPQRHHMLMRPGDPYRKWFHSTIPRCHYSHGEATTHYTNGSATLITAPTP